MIKRSSAAFTFSLQTEAPCGTAIKNGIESMEHSKESIPSGPISRERRSFLKMADCLADYQWREITMDGWAAQGQASDRGTQDTDLFQSPVKKTKRRRRKSD